MKAEKMMNAISGISDKHIQEFAVVKPVVMRSTVWKRVLLVAGLALVLLWKYCYIYFQPVTEFSKGEVIWNTESEVEFEVQAYTFAEIVENSNVALYGQYIETYEYEHYVEHKFKVNEVLYGTVSDLEIYLYANKGTAHIAEDGYSYEMDASIYEKNKEYLLILEKNESIMYDHDRYLAAAELLLCETDKEYMLYSEVIEIPSGLTLKEYVLSMKNLANVQEGIGSTDFTSGDEDEWIGSSEYIGKVKILAFGESELRVTRSLHANQRSDWRSSEQ